MHCINNAGDLLQHIATFKIIIQNENIFYIILNHPVLSCRILIMLPEYALQLQ